MCKSFKKSSLLPPSAIWKFHCTKVSSAQSSSMSLSLFSCKPLSPSKIKVVDIVTFHAVLYKEVAIYLPMILLVLHSWPFDMLLWTFCLLNISTTGCDILIFMSSWWGRRLSIATNKPSLYQIQESWLGTTAKKLFHSLSLKSSTVATLLLIPLTILPIFISSRMSANPSQSAMLMVSFSYPGPYSLYEGNRPSYFIFRTHPLIIN